MKVKVLTTSGDEATYQDVFDVFTDGKDELCINGVNGDSQEYEIDHIVNWRSYEVER